MDTVASTFPSAPSTFSLSVPRLQSTTFTTHTTQARSVPSCASGTGSVAPTCLTKNMSRNNNKYYVWLDIDVEEVGITTLAHEVGVNVLAAGGEPDSGRAICTGVEDGVDGKKGAGRRVLEESCVAVDRIK